MLSSVESKPENILEKFYIHFNPFPRKEKPVMLEKIIEPQKIDFPKEKVLEKILTDFLIEIPKKTLETITTFYHSFFNEVKKYTPLLKKKEVKKFHKLPWRDKIEDWGGSRYYRSLGNEARYVSPLRSITRKMAYMWICVVKQVK